ncbi:MAG TPA: alternative ribosome rescue aminoacyl-tRNA hydrolase ArfB [Cyclobacteriaceae bacterium]|nr:alternative ribosome rescue aminoacyl-tRNA hydrolase ArfB [Cyclobacteriaceae bacterium]
MKQPDTKELLKEASFTAVRSAGAGGQHVNKVSSKVQLKFDVVNSYVLDAEQKALILQKLAGKINNEGQLIISAQEDRSQLKNKAICKAKFEKLIQKAFYQPKARKKTKPSKSVKERRLKSKKIQSEKKAQRKFRA